MIDGQRRNHQRIWLVLAPLLLFAVIGATLVMQRRPQERPPALEEKTQ